MWSFLIVAVATVAAAAATPLDEYVWMKDDHYGWTDLGEEHVIHGRNIVDNNSWTGYTLNLTSQQWLTDEDFDASSQAKSVWWHYLLVIVPENVDYKANASLYITGGGQSMGFPQPEDEDVWLAASIAMMTNTVTGVLFQIPNEHITFSSDPDLVSRTEGSIDAFTWDHFLKDQSDPTWLYYFPMTKASVRAMDAMTEFASKKFPELGLQLDFYTVLGASKRGWTTWLTGAVDLTRVMAIVPIVLDAINFRDVIHHQYRSYGGWTYALEDYYDMDIMSRLDSEEMTKWTEIMDPYVFLDRLTMPTLVVNAALDEFQQPDDNHYWWKDLPEPKRSIMTPNADHSEATGIPEIVPAISTWIRYNLDEIPVPNFSWEINPSSGEVTVVLDDLGTVFEASVWYAYSCGMNSDGTKRRDFRMVSLDAPCDCGKHGYDGYCVNLQSGWTRKLLEAATNDDGKRQYNAYFEAPSDGRYVAYFIDVKYEDVRPKLKASGIPYDKPGRLEFTTQVSVWPNTFPYEDCVGEECRGVLL